MKLESSSNNMSMGKRIVQFTDFSLLLPSICDCMLVAISLYVTIHSLD